MNIRLPATLLTPDEILNALVALGEDPTASRIDQVRALVDAAALPERGRDEAIRVAVDSARLQLTTKSVGRTWATVDSHHAEIGSVDAPLRSVSPNGQPQALGETAIDTFSAKWGMLKDKVAGVVGSYLAGSQRKVRESWSESDAEAARSQGWALVNLGLEGAGYMVQMMSEGSIFINDVEALAYVSVRAQEGDALAMKAARLDDKLARATDSDRLELANYLAKVLDARGLTLGWTDEHPNGAAPEGWDSTNSADRTGPTADPDHAKVAFVDARLRSVSPDGQPAVGRYPEIGTFAAKWGLLKDKVAGIVESYLAGSQRKVSETWSESDADAARSQGWALLKLGFEGVGYMASELESVFGSEHPQFDRRVHHREVECGNTKIPLYMYWEWVAHQIHASGHTVEEATALWRLWQFSEADIAEAKDLGYHVEFGKTGQEAHLVGRWWWLRDRPGYEPTAVGRLFDSAEEAWQDVVRDLRDIPDRKLPETQYERRRGHILGNHTVGLRAHVPGSTVVGTICEVKHDGFQSTVTMELDEPLQVSWPGAAGPISVRRFEVAGRYIWSQWSQETERAMPPNHLDIVGRSSGKQPDVKLTSQALSAQYPVRGSMPSAMRNQLYRLREAEIEALSAAHVITEANLRDLDRLGRLMVAEGLFEKCDEAARYALIHDDHPHVRSCAKISMGDVEEAVLLKANQDTSLEM
jgi:hypothetical protein